MDDRPETYEELYREYFAEAVKLCRSAGVREAEDAAQSIMVRLYERDLLNKFEPGVRSEFHSDKRVVSFRSYMMRCISIYVPGKRDLERGRQKKQTPLEAVMETEQSFTESMDHVLHEIETQEELYKLKDKLVQAPSRGRYVPQQVYNIAVRQWSDQGEVTGSYIAHALGISATAGCTYLKYLRSDIEACQM